jgi:hypothetical protein
VGDDAEWHGGQHREGLLSGFGPYALTRLALETGGSFTLLDRPGDGVTFSVDVLRAYQPDYESLADYRSMLDYHPLREAVITAVERSYIQPIVAAPSFEFMGARSNRYPFASFRVYFPQAEFRAALAARLIAERQSTETVAQAVERALAAFGREGMEAAYRLEKSARWRAWYDVTRGRLLAASVRYYEYQLTCSSILDDRELAPQTNWIALRPSDELRGGEQSAARAREAKRLLGRCLSANHETPWAYLAQWELDHPFGLSVEQAELPRPLPVPAAPAEPAAAINLPKF